MSKPSPGHREALSVSPSEDVHCVLDEGLLSVIIDRPEKRNPLSLGVLETIRRAFEGHANCKEVRLATITGRGEKAFASGGDLNELSVYRSKAEAEAFSLHGKAALNAIRSFPVPVIARLNGIALGGGAELALACDLRLAVSHAKIGFIHGRLKIAPSWGGGHDLMRLVGPARGLGLLAEAEILDARDALRLGLFDAVCPAVQEFDDWFEERIRVMADNPPQVMRAFKAAAGRMRARSDADAIETAHFADVWVHQDHWTSVDELKRPNK